MTTELDHRGSKSPRPPFKTKAQDLQPNEINSMTVEDGVIMGGGCEREEESPEKPKTPEIESGEVEAPAEEE